MSVIPSPGLNYIIVQLLGPEAVCTPAAMKESPHECVLCLPNHTFNAVSLAKHIASAQHLTNVLVSILGLLGGLFVLMLEVLSVVGHFV